MANTRRPYLTPILLRGVTVRGTSNFSGLERRNRQTGAVVNAAGKRNCLIELDPDKAEELAAAEWPVVLRRSAKDGSEYWSMTVHLSFEPVEPIKVVLVTGGHKQTLYSKGQSSPTADADNINIVDSMIIKKLDLKLKGAPTTNIRGEEVYKAWIEVIYIYAEDPDPFADDDDEAVDEGGAEPEYNPFR